MPFLRRLVLGACLLGMTPFLAVAANKIVLIKVEQQVALRASASFKADSVEPLLCFQPVAILENKTVAERPWARVKTIKADPSKSVTGWLPAKCLTACDYATVDDDPINVRRGPDKQYDVIMHYARNYPVQALDVASNGWVKIRDCDGDMGWVSPKALKLGDPYVITHGSEEPYNVRDGAGTKSNVKFKAEKGYLLKMLEEKDGWLHVKDSDGEDGWISVKLVFGWMDPVAKGGDAGQDEDKAGSKDKASSKKTDKGDSTSAKPSRSGKTGKKRSKKPVASAPQG